MNEETHLINDLHVRRESAGGWEFVHLRDSDDGDTFMLGEDEILALHKYLGSLISEKRLYPLTFEGAIKGRYSGHTHCGKCGGLHWMYGPCRELLERDETHTGDIERVTPVADPTSPAAQK